jgi:hypothetical protein
VESVYSSLLGDNDVVHDPTIEQMAQAVFSANPLVALRGYISGLTKLNSVSQSLEFRM